MYSNEHFNELSFPTHKAQKRKCKMALLHFYLSFLLRAPSQKSPTPPDQTHLDKITMRMTSEASRHSMGPAAVTAIGYRREDNPAQFLEVDKTSEKPVTQQLGSINQLAGCSQLRTTGPRERLTGRITRRYVEGRQSKPESPKSLLNQQAFSLSKTIYFAILPRT